jgi:predicted ribosome quality control (RQC) complex YloA/Tae2 family protein
MESDKKELSCFRIFKLGDGFEVWTGKDSSANDLLSMKYARRNDLWFHVRGTSGSHTILRMPEEATDIPKDHIKTAAEIAAYYSKAKNAKNVSVAYTLSKNVMKYKGAKSGSVVVKSDKVIKVQPKIPEISNL